MVPLGRGQRAAHLETAEIAGARNDHLFDRVAGPGIAGLRIKVGKSGHGGLRVGRWLGYRARSPIFLPHFTSSGSLPFGLPSGPKVIFSMRSSALFEQRLAMFLQVFATLVDGDRLFERHGALFELIDDRFEFGESPFEGQAGNIVWRVVQERTSWQGRQGL